MGVSGLFFNVLLSAKLKLYNFPTGPMVLGVILGPQMDVNFRRAIISEEGNVVSFLASLVSYPISLVLTIILLATILSQTAMYGKVKEAIFRKVAKKNAYKKQAS